MFGRKYRFIRINCKVYPNESKDLSEQNQNTQQLDNQALLESLV